MSCSQYPAWKSRRAAWIAGLLALAMGWPLGVQAQETPPALESLTIELWPEFDRPGVLVIYDGVLSAAEGPAQVSLLLPAGAELNAVAFFDPATGDLLEAEREVETVGDRTRVTLTTQAGNFWVEFYAPADALTLEGDRRSYTHTWDGDLAVERLTWRVQQPATASDLVVEPGGGQMGTDSFGLPIYTVETGELAAGETASARVSYQKSDDVLSASQLMAAQPAPETQQPPAPARPTNLLLPVGLVVLGIALLTGGIFVWWRSGRAARSGPRRKAAQADSPRQPAAGYCTNCGNALQPGDKFCRECGTPIRR